MSDNKAPMDWLTAEPEPEPKFFHSCLPYHQPKASSWLATNNNPIDITSYHRLVGPPPGFEHLHPLGHRRLVSISANQYHILRASDPDRTDIFSVHSRSEMATTSGAITTHSSLTLGNMAPMTLVFGPDQDSETATPSPPPDNTSTGYMYNTNQTVSTTHRFAPSKMALKRQSMSSKSSPATISSSSEGCSSSSSSSLPHTADPAAVGRHHVHGHMQSTKYEGDPTLRRNQRVVGLPDHLNTAFWLTGLPPQLTTKDLLSAIRGFGRVYATVINRPESPENAVGTGRNTVTCAAKIVFFEARAAQAFYHAYGKVGLSVGGYEVKVVYNRVSMPEDYTAPPHASRVVVFRGPKGVVNAEYLTRMFRQKIAFDVDDVIVRAEEDDDGDGERELEYRFGSWRAQAEAVIKMLRVEARLFPGVKYCYGLDPCALVGVEDN